MTEQDWLTTTNPYDLMRYKAPPSDRKRRLLSCAMARQALFLMPDDGYRQAIEMAERYADGEAPYQEVRATLVCMNKAWNDRQFGQAGDHAAAGALELLRKKAVVSARGWEAAAFARASLAGPDWERARNAEKEKACAFARDVFGNPFRPVAVDRAWLTTSVIALAQAAYEDRRLPEGTLDEARLAVLADALEDAGCDNPDVLTHCRQPGVHVRGCWALDLILAKE